MRRILAHLPQGVTAAVAEARYSKADLHTARTKLLYGGKPEDLHIAGTSTPIRISSVAPTPQSPNSSKRTGSGSSGTRNSRSKAIRMATAAGYRAG